MKVEIKSKYDPSVITYEEAKGYRGRFGKLPNGALIIIAGGIIGPVVLQEIGGTQSSWTHSSPSITLLPEGTEINIKF